MTLPVLGAGQNWYVAFTQPNGETRAAMHLRNQGFPTYLPRFRRRRSGRQPEKVIAPLFPRYIFLGIDLDRQRWRSVNGTIGVTHLVCHGERPTAIDEGIIAAIANREDIDGLVRLARASSFQPGQAVRVTDGVFMDQIGLYECLCDQDRVRILLNLLGRKVRVALEAEAVVAA
jgi:transcriptional antiterminator RfaH